ncbi:hypothetical protein PCANB_002792 [Pneumocystis canis]|nr:hypothetical protein PCANB_002792 [Pneumocystis canis]
MWVESLILSNKVVVFSKTFCPYCNRTKELFQNSGIEYYVLELDKINEGYEIQKYLYEKTGQKTVPNIFISTEHIGGNSDLETLKKNGKLDEYFK